MKYTSVLSKEACLQTSGILFFGWDVKGNILSLAVRHALMSSLLEDSLRRREDIMSTGERCSGMISRIELETGYSVSESKASIWGKV